MIEPYLSNFAKLVTGNVSCPLSVQWPFVRFLGIQEPASVLFSIFNGVGHILGWRMFKSTVPNTDYNMYSIWKVNLLVRLQLSNSYLLLYLNNYK